MPTLLPSNRFNILDERYGMWEDMFQQVLILLHFFFLSVFYESTFIIKRSVEIRPSLCAGGMSKCSILASVSSSRRLIESYHSFDIDILICKVCIPF